MNNLELQALRRLLFFTQAEAAAMIGGVTERAWKYWEAGGRAIPADVALRVAALASWRRKAVNAVLKRIAASYPGKLESSDVILVWYDRLSDWETLPRHHASFWRPHCSAMAELVASDSSIRLVLFDLSAYTLWLAGRNDSASMRADWAVIFHLRRDQANTGM